MTTTRSAQPPATPAQTTPLFRLPDIPEKHPDDMTSFQHLASTGNAHNVAQYLGHQDTTIVSGERYIVPGPAYVAGESRYPDLLVAFDVIPAAYEADNGYIISRQGKAPDFILEVASRHTAADDLGPKKDYYERLGVGELWLFDSEGRFHGFTLRGYRLVDGRYEEIDLSEIAPGVFQGYSAALNVLLRAEGGHLGWHDPATGEHIPTFQSERARADAERAERIREAARARTAEARVQELAAELDRLRAGR